jgi:hypothetical protein
MTSYPTDLNDSQWQVIEAFVLDKRKRWVQLQSSFKRYFLFGENGLSMADAAPRLSPMAKRIFLF